MDKSLLKKDSPQEQITEYFLKMFGKNGVESIEIPWRDYNELRGIPSAEIGSPEWAGHREKRNRDKDSLNRWWRHHHIALQFMPGVPGVSIILHRKDDVAHAEIVRTFANKCRDILNAALRLDELSQAEGLSAPASASLQKARKVFMQSRMVLAKSANNLGLPETTRKQLMNCLIPPGKWPWQKDDDYESQFLFG